MNQTSVNPTTLACRRYQRQMLVTVIVYMIVLFGSVTALKHIPAGALRYAVSLLPLIPVAFLVPIVLRYLRETDEYERRMQVESLAIAAGVTAMLSVTYGFLELAGLPHLSAWWTWTVLMVAWAVARPLLARCYQ
jgi:hypothetical protein